MRTVREVYADAMAEPEPAPGSGRVHINNYLGEYEIRLHGDLEVPVIRNLDAAIVERVTDSAGDGELKMSGWHCGIAHCRGGWATHLGGDAAHTLEECLDVAAAAALIYYESCGWIPDFSADQHRFEADMGEGNYNPEEMALADMLAGAALDPIPSRRKLRVTGERRANRRGHGERRGRPTPTTQRS